MLYHGVLVRLYEPVAYMRPPSSLADPADTSRRTEALWNCLQALNDFFRAHLAIPADRLGCLPFVAMAYLFFALVTASRLLFLEDPNWDLGLARKSLDLVSIATRLGDHYQTAELYILDRKKKFTDDQRSMLAVYRDKIRWVRRWYLSKLPGEAPLAMDPGSFLSLAGHFDAAFWETLLNLDGRMDLSYETGPAQPGSASGT